MLINDIASMHVTQGENFIKFAVPGFNMQKQWTQSDIRFCENEGSKIFKTNEIRGQLDRKLRAN